MHPHRDASSVIGYRGGTVCFQSYPDDGTISRQMFVHRIIHNLINQMVESLGGHTADIHAGPYPDSLQPFQDSDTGSVIGICLCHISSILPLCSSLYYTCISVCFQNGFFQNSKIPPNNFIIYLVLLQSIKYKIKCFCERFQAYEGQLPRVSFATYKYSCPRFPTHSTRSISFKSGTTLAARSRCIFAALANSLMVKGSRRS